MDIRRFFIKPPIPEKIRCMEELAFNIWASWDKDAEKIFHRLDPKLYRKVNHNPVEFLYRLNPERLNEAAKDKGFLYELRQVYEKYQTYMSYEGTHTADGEERPFTGEDIACYICTEYGLHEAIPLYSGGLAVLAGDQLKAASDVGYPLVSFGLLYRYGYFNQRVMPDGTQVEEFSENTWYLSPIKEVSDENSASLIIEIPLKKGIVYAKLWKIQVGKVPLYLLDTNIHQNPPNLRKITNTLYDPDRATRLEQELVLGRGTIIALRVLGIKPRIFHLNEGHTAFSILERLIDLVARQKYSFDDAAEIIRFSTVFTTHTPVVEGNEHFSDELIKKYLEDEVKALGLTMDDFLALGKLKKEKLFWLPALAIRFSNRANGVSEIHGRVSREMWKGLFPTMHEREIPIDSVTNGIHLQSWLSLQMTELFDRYIGPDYLHKAEQQEVWDQIENIPDGEIWNAHRRRKEQVTSFVRRRVGEMMKRRGYCRNKIKDVEEILNPDYLTIGFARRFAPYKRANLILRDPDRLAAILTNPDKPVQMIFAGKAHPADAMGKDILKQIFSFINNYPVEKHFVFIEDYDINVARHLVQGVDVWLNTPVVPMEASGTSGMKAAINGGLNLSILDGWWPEAFNGENGWAISGGSSDNPEISQDAEANHLYELLEGDVTEIFYNRKEADIPLDWVKMMKNSITTVCGRFNMHRTVREYFYKFYQPQMAMSQRISDNGSELLKRINKYKKRIDAIWPQVYVRDYFTSINGNMPISGEKVDVDCYIYLGDADEQLLSVEVFYCFGENAGACMKIPLNYVERYNDKVAKYTGSIGLKGTGLQEISARLVPADPDFRSIYSQYVKWKE